jgi:hypothetical protein
MQMKSVFLPLPNQGATPVSDTPVDDTTPAPSRVELIQKRQTFLLSTVEANLFKDSKKLYSKLYDAMTTTKNGLQKLEKHAQDRTVPTSMRLKPLLVSSPLFNYDSIFLLPNDIDATVDTPVQARMKELKDQAEADLLTYQAQHIQRCIDDKRYHLRNLDKVLTTFSTEMVKKLTRQLTDTHGEETGVMVQRISHQFTSWQRDFLYLRKQARDSKNSSLMLQAARKAAAEQLLADKYAKFTPVEMAMEAIRLSSKTNIGKKPNVNRKKPKHNNDVPRKKPKHTKEAPKNVKSAAGKRAASTQAQRKPMRGQKSTKEREGRVTTSTRGGKGSVKAKGKGRGRL